ncbi:acyl-CoA synthetase [Mycolicibacterium wolinskyi]|uniref:Acyl-CoA synthetase n=1 Tax=Mycolicibacterium wolinskyi TaxID=59750 RepID=A0A1X2F2V0_9MYCO|nr:MULTISPECIES: acyl-CoA synthetase [Mycolicibacterium]MCV7287734.1 acyl-CoA synthetase [Mycolicibacterium wolinskyi]MCV7294632.1 acyl-CoA synthetase [Mycolicibacterium goodii]ORX12698.1 acyl-CoA synthetase [Mycolicibacterium wolinskyi]
MATTSVDTSAVEESKLWPRYASPDDLADIEAVPFTERGLPDSTYSLLVRAAALWPHRNALTVIPDAGRWRDPLQCSYSLLLSEVHRYANLLHSVGIRRDDAVALIAPNCAELIPATLAAQVAGIAAPINGGLSRTHIKELLRRSGARVLIVAGPDLSDSTWQLASGLASDGLLDTVLVLRHTRSNFGGDSMPVIDDVRFGYLHELAEEQDPSAFVGEPPVGADLAALIHTGGTTGVPKLAAQRHSAQVANAWMIAAAPLFGEYATLFSALPLFHVNALVVSVLAPMFKGHTVVWAGPLGYRDPLLYPVFWKLVERYQISLMSAVPTVYAALAEHPVNADISSLRHGIVGASPLPRAVRQRFERGIGVTLVEGYGLTEATCASALSFPRMLREGSVGQRFPYQNAKIVGIDEDGRWHDLPTGAMGVLALSGPTLFAGYVTGQDDTGAHQLDGLNTVIDGWLNTGDLAHLDAEGFIYLHGRAKDLIIRGGHNIDPAVIEEALMTCPGVTAAAAVGRPDAHAGEVPVAYVTLAAGESITEDDILAWAAGRVPEPVAIPKSVTVLEALPLTAVGKPYKPALRADAVRQVLVDALVGIPGVESVATTVDEGAIHSVIELSEAADETKVAEILDRYPLQWRVIRTAERLA